MRIYKLIWILSIIGICACADKESAEQSNNFISNSSNKEYGGNRNSSQEFLKSLSLNNSNSIDPFEYVAWIRNPESGFKKIKEIGIFSFEAMLKPKEYMALMDAGVDEINKETLLPLIEQYDQMQYYELKIEIKKTSGELIKYGLNNQGEYQQRVIYYASNADKDAYLIYDNSDTVKCSMHHWERNYDVGPVCILQFAFLKKEDDYENKVFVFNDRVFGNGPLKFRFRKNEIELPLI